MSVTRNREAILALARQHGFKLREEQGEIGLLIFDRDGVQINIYTTTMTVATALDHPKAGKTQLFRRGVSMGLLSALFRKPRLHTGKGYFGKKPQRAPLDLLGISKEIEK